MKQPSLSKRIEEYLKKQYPLWIHSGEIERLALNAGFKSSNAGRRCREMVSGKLSDGKFCPIVLERKDDKKCVWYRWKSDIIEAPKPQKKVVFINNQPTLIYG